MDADSLGDACDWCILALGNMDCSLDGAVDISDLTVLIDHLFLSYDKLCCPVESDIAPFISGGEPDGLVDIADLTALIGNLFINYPPMPECP